MKVKLLTTCLLATALSAVTASAHILVTVLCPISGNSAAGIHVCATLTTDSSKFVCGDTDSIGFVKLTVPVIPGKYHVCVDTTTLPAGATLSKPCQDVTFTQDAELPVEFDLDGPFCAGVPSACWETGGGTIDIDEDKDHPSTWSFGGVIYPGCSATAAGGGNLNVVNHTVGLHFKGEEIHVVDCRGIPDKSPAVTVNIIDFTGTGEVSGIDGNPFPTTLVKFEGTFRDHHDSGANADGLYLKVTISGTTTIISAFSIGMPADLQVLSTGNVQIHQSGCGK